MKEKRAEQLWAIRLSRRWYKTSRSGFASTSCDAREAAHDFFASFANGCKSADEILKNRRMNNENFSQFLNPLREALESITLDDGIMFGKDFEDFVADNPDADGAGDGEDEYDESTTSTTKMRRRR